MPPGSQISSRDQYAPIFLRNKKLHQFMGRGKEGAGNSGGSGFSGFSGFKRVQRVQRVQRAQRIQRFSGFSGFSGFQRVQRIQRVQRFSGFSGFSGFQRVRRVQRVQRVQRLSGFSGFSPGRRYYLTPLNPLLPATFKGSQISNANTCSPRLSSSRSWTVFEPNNSRIISRVFRMRGRNGQWIGSGHPHGSPGRSKAQGNGAIAPSSSSTTSRTRISDGLLRREYPPPTPRLLVKSPSFRRCNSICSRNFTGIFPCSDSSWMW
jgi:hypothetical protein